MAGSDGTRLAGPMVASVGRARNRRRAARATSSVVTAAILARPFKNQTPGLDFDSLSQRAAAAPNAGPAAEWVRLDLCTGKDDCPNAKAFEYLRKNAAGNAAVWIVAMDIAAEKKDATEDEANRQLAAQQASAEAAAKAAAEAEAKAAAEARAKAAADAAAKAAADASAARAATPAPVRPAAQPSRQPAPLDLGIPPGGLFQSLN